MLEIFLYKIMKMYSYVSYYCSKLFHFFNNFKIFGLSFGKDKDADENSIALPTLELVKNNNKVAFSIDKLDVFGSNEFDFIMYSERGKGTRLFYEMPYLNKLLGESFVYCTYKFISVGMFIPELNLTYNLDITDYYIVGNKLNKFVLNYLVYLQYNDTTMDIGCKYILNIIDHNVNIVNFDETQELVFQLNDYSIA